MSYHDADTQGEVVQFSAGIGSLKGWCLMSRIIQLPADRDERRSIINTQGQASATCLTGDDGPFDHEMERRFSEADELMAVHLCESYCETGLSALL